MAFTTFVASLLATSILLSTSYSASIADVSERDLEQDTDRDARADSYSFFRDFGKTKFGGYYNKDNDSGGFNASYKDENGEFGGKIDADKDGKLSGNAGGQYSWNGGKTKLGGKVDFGKDGKPTGAFSFSHKFGEK